MNIIGKLSYSKIIQNKGVYIFNKNTPFYIKRYPCAEIQTDEIKTYDFNKDTQKKDVKKDAKQKLWGDYTNFCKKNNIYSIKCVSTSNGSYIKYRCEIMSDLILKIKLYDTRKLNIDDNIFDLIKEHQTHRIIDLKDLLSTSNDEIILLREKINKLKEKENFISRLIEENTKIITLEDLHKKKIDIAFWTNDINNDD